ncbi:hypothetical protein BDN70DRAFT_873304 [Pholiota conissans]|uniref:Rab-GAP TBC domain-containing protein n=1 Tax=Pholiota conissans TaxID=109636 RepID=A0A9P5ZA34_9AGAR|nr:hypothetical protein BDN70DRAFT_873304 [Pholiota conissans]
MKWDTATVKAQLRLASQRLGQVQAKHDSLANITYTDIATLIQRGNVSLAREKAEKLVMDEAYGDLLEELELQIGVVQEHIHELERRVPPSPIMLEATSSIIYSAPYIYTKDLDTVRMYLVQALGPDFARSAIGNRDHHVSRRVLEAIAAPIPSAFQLDAYMQDIAQRHGVTWTPDPPRQSNINILSELLDPEAGPNIDLTRLRKLCQYGIPDEPSWLRPRIWKLLLGTVPPVKASWKAEVTKQRDAYYDLVRRLLEPLSRSTGDLASADETILEAYKELSGLPKSIFSLIEDEPELFRACPLNETAPEDVRIAYARVLETRLKALQKQEQYPSELSLMPEIRLETEEHNITPSISLTSSDASTQEDLDTSTTLLPSRKRIFGTAHPQHCSALLRLVYLHNVINPGNFSYHTPSLLIPIYSVMLKEADEEELSHLEADTFWLLEALVAEFAGLEDEEGNVWMKKFSDRVGWADFDYKTQLEASGLDPALPHYSYRWLMPILTHTIPLNALFLVWDALFSQPSRERSSNPKLDYLVDICTSMLIRAKNNLSRIGTVGHGFNSLWQEELQTSAVPDQAQDGFMESLSFLQRYNPQFVGGVERILQVASELAQRREQEAAYARQPSLSLGARFSMWRGTASQSQNTVVSSSKQRKHTRDFSDGNETETPSSVPSTLASTISNKFWRGITNQSAMEDEYPSAPPSPAPSSPFAEHFISSPPIISNGFHTESSTNNQTSNIWGYAEKIKSSDTVASLSKVSTNWRAKALLGSWSLNGSTPPAASNIKEKEVQPRSVDIPSRRTSSLSFLSSPGLLSPPPVPPKSSPHHGPSPLSPPPSAGLLEKTKSLIAMRSPPTNTPKSAPKPLLLAGSPIISGQRKTIHPRSASATSVRSTPDTDEWADVIRGKGHSFHRDSQSSVSSLSPSDALGRIPKSNRTEYESDTSSSRIVAINRRSISPMAPSFRVGNVRSMSRPSSRNSSASSDMHSPPLPPLLPSLVSKSSPLQESSSIESQPIVIKPGFQDSEDSETTSNEMPTLVRKPSWTLMGAGGDSENASPTSSASISSKPSKLRSKRVVRPANLQIQPRVSAEQKSPSPSKLTVEWPSDDQESIKTPKASNFDSDDYVSVSPVPVRSPRRTRKMSSNDQEKPRKSSIDTIMNEERPRKISTSNRTRKVSTGSREVPRSRRESAAEDGDDEGYDELLSAYESEEGPYLR